MRIWKGNPGTDAQGVVPPLQAGLGREREVQEHVV